MPKENLTYFWKKKEFISFLLSILVFLIHISTFSQHESNGTIVSEINQTVSYFFTESITRFAVPLFFVLSGATFFRNYSASSYTAKLKSRLFSLVIPYLIWNAVWMLFETACSYSFLSRFFIGREKFELTFINVLKGLFLYKCNIPFWFILNLIVFTVISPLIDFLISRKSLAYISVSGIIILRLCGIGLPANIFLDANAIIYYFIGAIIGRYYIDRFARKSTGKTQILSVIFLCLYVVLKTIYHPANFGAYQPLVDVVAFTLCAISFWNASDLFMDKVTSIPLFSRSFAIYALHTNVSVVITKLFALAVGKKEIWAIPNFVFTLICTLVLIDLFCTFTKRYCPKMYSLIMGQHGH